MSNQGFGGPQDPNQPNQGPWQQQPNQPGGYPPPPPIGGGQHPYGQSPFKPVGDPGTLDLPWYGIGFGQAIKRAFQKYVRFDGRASRSEFWWFYLFNFIVGFVLSIPARIISISQAVSAARNGNPIDNTATYLAEIPSTIWFLVVLLPAIGLMWRRLHDTNRSGAWFFLYFACGIGGLVPLIMCIFDSNPEGQRFDRIQNPGGYGQAPGGYPPAPGY